MVFNEDGTNDTKTYRVFKSIVGDGWPDYIKCRYYMYTWFLAEIKSDYVTYQDMNFGSKIIIAFNIDKTYKG